MTSPTLSGRYASDVSLMAGQHRLVAIRPATAGPRGPRSWPPHVVDAAVALAALAGSLALLAHGGGLGVPHPGRGDLDPVRVALVVASTLPLTLWRRSPRVVFGLSAAASMLLATTGDVVWPPLGPAAALYLFASSRDDSSPWTRRSAGVVVLLLLAYLGTGFAVIGFAGGDLLHAGLACAAAWFAGERTRLRREQLAELHHRAMSAELDAVRERQLAVAEERARIARDLHDSAGHALNVIAIRAGAARLRYGTDPERALSALVAIEDMARETVGDIDRFVGALRSQDADGSVESPPGLASLDMLLAQHTAAGLVVTLDRTGAGRHLGAPVDQAVYRIVQEALTNAARYGAGAAHVALTCGDDALDLAVTNQTCVDASVCETDGHGLVGMRERAVLLGGQLSAEALDGSFRVHAQIPYGGRRG